MEENETYDKLLQIDSYDIDGKTPDELIKKLEEINTKYKLKYKKIRVDVDSGIEWDCSYCRISFEGIRDRTQEEIKKIEEDRKKDREERIKNLKEQLKRYGEE